MYKLKRTRIPHLRFRISNRLLRLSSDERVQWFVHAGHLESTHHIILTAAFAAYDDLSSRL